MRLPGGSPPSVQNGIATKGARALVRSGIRSDGERSSPDALVQFGAKAPCTEALALRGAAGWFLPAARIMGSMRGDSREVPEVLDTPTSCSRMDSTAGIGQRRSGRTPRGDEPRLVHKGSRATLVGRMREHRRRTERPVNTPRKRFVGQQRELPLTEERPPRLMARTALTSDACKKGEGSEGHSHIPSGMARRAVSKEPAPKVAREGWRERSLAHKEVRGFSGGSRHGRQRRA